MLKKSAGEKDLDLVSVGEKLRLRRKELKLTLSDVAHGAGLSVGFISQVERNITAPSLGSLASIATLLQLPVNAFLDGSANNEEFTRVAERPIFAVKGADVSYERLSSTFAGSTIHSVIIHEQPGHRVEPISHEGEEMFYIISGEVTVEIDGQKSKLKQGDSVHFNSRRTHSIWNHTNNTTSILWCGTMDIFGDENPEPIHKDNNNNITITSNGDGT